MTEEYLDEIILKEKNRRRKEQTVREILEEGLPDEILQTVEIGEIAKMKIPSFFQDMPREIAERKYSFEPCPQIIKTNREGTVDFTFSVLEVKVSGEQLPEAVAAAKKGMQRIRATAVFQEEGQETIQGMEVCWFSYVRTSPEGEKIYNMIFYVAAEQSLAITMCCLVSLWEKWSAVARYCISTLKGR